MKTVEDYLRHAKEAGDLAEQAQTPAQKAEILQIAEMWRSLAQQRAQLLQPPKH